MTVFSAKHKINHSTKHISKFQLFVWYYICVSTKLKKFIIMAGYLLKRNQLHRSCENSKEVLLDEVINEIF